MISEKKGAKHNSISHGVFANILLSGNPFGEERDHYLALISILRSSLRPVNGLEEILVEKLAFLFLRLTRLYKADVKVAPRMFARAFELLGTGQPSIQAKWISPDDQAIVVQHDPSSDSLMRYEANLERQISKTLDLIDASQRLRGGNPTPALPAAEQE
jgi:hypothetical protein